MEGGGFAHAPCGVGAPVPELEPAFVAFELALREVERLAAGEVLGAERCGRGGRACRRARGPPPAGFRRKLAIPCALLGAWGFGPALAAGRSSRAAHAANARPRPKRATAPGPRSSGPNRPKGRHDTHRPAAGDGEAVAASGAGAGPPSPAVSLAPREPAARPGRDQKKPRQPAKTESSGSSDTS